MAGADTPPGSGGDFGYTSPWTFDYAQAQGGGDDAGGAGVLARLDTGREIFGDVPDGYQAQYQAEVAKQQQLYPASVAGPQWQSLGPTGERREQNFYTVKGTDSGIASQILQDPRNADTVYVVADGGGLWKTMNFSAPKPTWAPLTDHLIETVGGHAAFGRDGALYYGVGSPWYGNPAIGGVVYASHDGGATWGPFANLAGASAVLSLAVDSTGTTDVVLAGTDFGLFHSTDQGTTFGSVTGVPTRQVLRPGSGAEQVYVWGLVRTSAGWLASAETGTTGKNSVMASNLYLSTDQTATWQPVVPSALLGAGRTTLAVAQDGDPVVYALTASAAAQDQAQGDLYRSTDGGRQWIALHVTGQTPTNPNADQPRMDLLGKQAYYNQALLIDRADPSRNTVLIGGQLSSARTTDGGLSWTLTSNWLGQFGLPYVHADFHGAAQLTIAGRDAFAYGTDGGIAVSTDGAGTWDTSKNQGLDTALVYNVMGQPGDPKNVILTLQDEGTRLRQGNTGIYNQVEGGDGIGVARSQSGGAALTAVPFGKIAFSDKTPNKYKK